MAHDVEALKKLRSSAGIAGDGPLGRKISLARILTALLPLLVFVYSIFASVMSWLGYEAIYTATALVQRAGEPAKAVLIDPARETLMSFTAAYLEIDATYLVPGALPLRTAAQGFEGQLDVVGQVLEGIEVAQRLAQHRLDGGGDVRCRQPRPGRQ